VFWPAKGKKKKKVKTKKGQGWIKKATGQRGRVLEEAERRVRCCVPSAGGRQRQKTEGRHVFGGLGGDDGEQTLRIKDDKTLQVRGIIVCWGKVQEVC